MQTATRYEKQVSATKLSKVTAVPTRIAPLLSAVVVLQTVEMQARPKGPATEPDGYRIAATMGTAEPVTAL